MSGRCSRHIVEIIAFVLLGVAVAREAEQGTHQVGLVALRCVDWTASVG